MFKILHVISDKNIGGAGKLLLNLIKESDKNEFCHVVALPCGSLLADSLAKLGIEIFETSLSFFPLYKLIKMIKPHAVHSHAAAVSRIAAHLCGISTLNTKHCADFYAPRPRFLRRTATRIFDSFFTDATIATADYVKTRLINEGVYAKKIWVIVNGSLPIKKMSEQERYLARKQLGYSEKDLIVAIVGRLEHGKGQEYFIDAAKFSEKSNPEIKFLIVGDGSKAKALKKQAAGLKNLKFLGFLPNVSDIMNIIDVNCNCSFVSETSSLSLSEGMSVGAVPIVSNCGGNPFMAADCGIVLPPKNSHALADTLISLSGNRNHLKELSQKSEKRFYKEFTAQAMTRKTEALYKKLLPTNKIQNN